MLALTTTEQLGSRPRTSPLGARSSSPRVQSPQVTARPPAPRAPRGLPAPPASASSPAPRTGARCLLRARRTAPRRPRGLGASPPIAATAATRLRAAGASSRLVLATPAASDAYGRGQRRHARRRGGRSRRLGNASTARKDSKPNGRHRGRAGKPWDRRGRKRGSPAAEHGQGRADPRLHPEAAPGRGRSRAGSAAEKRGGKHRADRPAVQRGPASPRRLRAGRGGAHHGAAPLSGCSTLSLPWADGPWGYGGGVCEAHNSDALLGDQPLYRWRLCPAC